jgi:hypothetical protein
MKKFILYICTSIFFVIVILALFFYTNLFQALGVKIPRNYSECYEFGGNASELPHGERYLAVTEECNWHGLKFYSFVNF